MSEKKTEVVEVKKPWQSKTNWISLLIALAGFWPSAGDWVANNPDMFMKIMGGLFLGLRWVTKGKVSIK